MISVSDRSGIHHFDNFDDYLQYVEESWQCDFCDPYNENNCHKTKMCYPLAAYEDQKTKGRLTAVCRSMNRPRETCLQDRIVALVELTR